MGEHLIPKISNFLQALQDRQLFFSLRGSEWILFGLNFYIYTPPRMAKDLRELLEHLELSGAAVAPIMASSKGDANRS
jgi:hypothetical protein